MAKDMNAQRSEGNSLESPEEDFISSLFSKTIKKDPQKPGEVHNGGLHLNIHVKDEDIPFLDKGPQHVTEGMIKEEVSLYPTIQEANKGASKGFDAWNQAKSIEETKDIIAASPEGNTDVSDEKSSQKAKKGWNLPLKPLALKVVLTIAEDDIVKYLKDNEFKIAEENKKSGHEGRLSIIKKISLLVGTTENAIWKVAAIGPNQRKGNPPKFSSPLYIL